MTRAQKLNIAGKTAIVAALMGGSSLTFAQAAAPTVAAPAQPAPIELPAAASVIAPPPAVSTLPRPNDIVNPAAAQEAAAEAPRQRQTATIAPAPPAKPRAAAPVRAAPIAAVSPEAPIKPSTDIGAPVVEATEPAIATIEDSAPVAPVEATVTETDGISTEDMTLIGGLAAALAAIGLGAAFASRRRRRVATDSRAPAVHAAPAYAAPRPIKDDPVFQRFAATSAPVTERPVQRTLIVTRPEVAVTDPLFSAPVAAAPITDPLFAPRNDVEIPITDPLFAKHERYGGRAPNAPKTNREPELVN